MSAAVYCRVRNLCDGNLIKTVTDKSITVDSLNGTNDTILSFEQVFTNADQDPIFTNSKPVIEKATKMLKSGTIAVYGATGSGKSYTLAGTGRRIPDGLVPRALKYIEEADDREVLSEISFVEIGVDNGILDLLDRSRPQLRSQLSRPVKISVRDAFDGCILFEKAATIRQDRQQPNMFLEAYLQGLERAAQRGTKNSLATCLQVTFTRKHNAKRCTLRFVEVYPRGKVMLEHCWRMKAHNTAKYRQSALTQFMKSSIEGSENLALFFCCGHESTKELLDFATLAQCVHADHVTPRESDVGSSKMTESADSSGRQDETFVADMLDRKRGFILLVQKDVRHNDVVIQEINAQLLARRQPRYLGSTRLLETELRRMLTQVMKTKAIQEGTLTQLNQELEALTQVHKMSQLRNIARSEKIFGSDKIGMKSVSTTEDLQPPEQAPEAVDSDVFDRMPSNPSDRSNASSAPFRGCLIPTLPLEMIPKQEDPPGKKPYIEAPRDPRRRGSESSDSGSGSPISDFVGTPMHACTPNPLLAQFPMFRPFSIGLKTRPPPVHGFSRPLCGMEADSLQGNAQKSTADALESPPTAESSYKPSPYRMMASASKTSLAQQTVSGLNPSASHASLPVDRLRLNTSNSQTSLADGKRGLRVTPSRFVSPMTYLSQKSFSSKPDMASYNGDAPDRMQTSGPLGIAPRFSKSPSINNLRHVSPFPWADARRPLVGIMPECGRMSPNLYSFQPVGRPVTIPDISGEQRQTLAHEISMKNLRMAH